ncbi:hypothetical protein EC957_010867 [Mortierella hygrophila]|uniref:Uncharacterized protein n=1 Tax=Mortierella hygrophila TaxID=979708 RepID=A0A9P6F8P3_9FUNG|nr:hypothetical protein EC957_010867 [Mortierella hygrophila]
MASFGGPITRDNTGTVRRREITLTTREKQLYGQLWAAADTDQSGFITGADAVPFFAKSGLSPQILGQIWVLADTDNKGVLGQQGFSVAVKLIAHAQNGKTPSTALINADAPLPHFEGITLVKTDSPLSGSTPVVSHSTGSDPTISESDRTKYANMFMAVGPVGGLLDGDKAREVFLKSKLPVDKLSQIWGLADTKLRGSLDLTDFTIAMFYIQRTMDGSISTLPTTLPPSVLKAAAGSAAGVGLMSSPVLSAQTLARQVTGGNMGIQNPTVARQMTGSMGLSSSPLAKQNTGGLSADSIPWEITPEEKAKFDRFFDQLDANGDGFIEGEEAGRFFMNSRLPESVLAQIWDLSDITKTGSLNKDEFAVAMLLINRKNATNAPIPKTLPLSLVPPSLRNRVTASLSAPLPFGSDITRSATMPVAPQHFRRQSFDLLGDGPTLTSSVSSSGLGHADKDLMGAEDLTSKITSETGELASMQNQINNLSNVTGDLANKRAFLEKNLSVLSAQKQDISIRLNQIKTLHENETKSIKDMENTLSSIQPQLIKLREEFEVSERDLRVAQTNKTEFLMTLAKDQEESNMIRARLRQNHDETIKLREELEAKKKDTGRQKSLLEIARRQLATSDADKQKLVNEIAQETEKAAQIARDIQTLSSSSPAPSSPAPSVSSSSAAPPPPAPRGSRKEPPPPPASRGTASPFASRVTPEAEEAFGIPPALRSPTGSFHSVHSPRMSAAAVISRQSTGSTPFEPVPRQATGSSHINAISRQGTGMSGTAASFASTGEANTTSSAFLSSIAAGAGPQDNPWSPMTHAAHAMVTQQSEMTLSPDPETPQVQSESLTAFAAAANQPLPTSPPVSDPFAAMAFPAMDTPPVTKMDFDSAFNGFSAPKPSSKSTADPVETEKAFAEAFPDIDAVSVSDDNKSKRVSAFGFEDDFSAGSPFQQSFEKTNEEDEFPPIVEVHHNDEDSSDSDDDNEDAFVQAKSSIASPNPAAAAFTPVPVAPVAAGTPQVEDDSSSPFLSAESSAVTPNVTGSTAAPIATPAASAPLSSGTKKLTTADFSEFETSFGGSGADDFDSAFKGVELAAPKVSSGAGGNMSGFDDGFDFNSSFDDAFGSTPFSAPQAPGSSTDANAFGASIPPASNNRQDSFGGFEMNTAGNNNKGGAAIDLDEAFGGFSVSSSTPAGGAGGASNGFGSSGFDDFEAEFASPAPPTSRPVPSAPAASAPTGDSTTTTANSASTGPVPPKVDLPGADELVGMGFTRQQANDALSRYDTVERAANFLLEGGQ